jgi:site-specific DNA-methyltransferase (adenine-specific)
MINILELNKIYNEDCLIGMTKIDDNSVDTIICDLPYGTTACKWDSVIPFDKLWEQYERVIKGNGAIVLFGTQPFTTELINSNRKFFKYCWIWNKKFAGNFVQAKRMPMRNYEDICVFSKDKELPKYYPQMVKREKAIYSGGNGQGDKAIPIKGDKVKEFKKKKYDEKFPEMIIEISNRIEPRGFHPTQKPVILMEYLLKTYSQENDIILDNCMGSGSTALACMNSNRQYIGFEMNQGYFDIANKRIEENIK